MSWYDSDWGHRAPILVNNFSGAATIDAQAVITKADGFTRFWENVDVSNAGADIRVTAADGVTLLTFDVDAFNATTEYCEIQIDNWSPGSADAGVVAWLYWGAAGKSDATTNFNPAVGFKTGYIEMTKPGSGTQRMVKCRPETPGATQPRTEIHKALADEIHLWWDLSGVLGVRSVPSQGHRLFDEIKHVTYDIEANGSPVGSMVDLAGVRMVGPAFIRTTVKAGTSGTNNVIILTVTLQSGRVLDFRATIRVQDVTEPT
jgi:hypothetical protein